MTHCKIYVKLLQNKQLGDNNIMNDYNGFKKIAQQNVLSTDETCEILGRTRQQLNNYVKSGSLEILKSTKNGNLFWRPDVYYLAKQIHKERIRHHHEILGGSTSQAYQAAKNLNLNPREISEIYVFFEEKDAIEKDFYYLDTLETPDTLIAIHAPNFVIIMEDETEYWFDGFNCGYGGEGPSGTEDILDYWGILEKTTDNFRNFIASTSILHIINENNTWTFYKEKSHYRLNDELCDQIKVRLYSFNQKLILTQENTNFHYTNSISTEILSKYIDFIPQPVSVEFLSQERALESGHFSVAFSKTILYQIIIKDITDRELWIEYPFEIIPPKEQQSMLELLNMLDINITDKSFIEKAKQWFGAKPRWINHKYTKEDFLS